MFLVVSMYAPIFQKISLSYKKTTVTKAFFHACLMGGVCSVSYKLTSLYLYRFLIFLWKNSPLLSAAISALYTGAITLE